MSELNQDIKTDAEGTVTLQLESVLEVFLELREEGWTSSKSNHVIDDIIEELQYHEFHVIVCKYCELLKGRLQDFLLKNHT
tara:strand:- start:1795 stop:2037 length:243 start_codon:yes stop_codon:yes gene_type:complete